MIFAGLEEQRRKIIDSLGVNRCTAAASQQGNVAKQHKTKSMEGIAVNKKIVLSGCCLMVVLFASMALVASGETKFVFSRDLRTVTAVNPPSQVTPGPTNDSGSTVIAGNFSTYPYATYFSIWGNTIDQGVNGYPFLIWQAEAFTPAQDATVTEIQASVGNQSGGTAGIELGLYDDANGVPGTKIKSFHVTTPPPYGQCCGVSSATDKAGIPVKGGTQYWLVVSTTPKDVDIYAWAFNSTNMQSQLGAYYCKGQTEYCGSNSGKWVAYQYVQNGFQILGN